MDDVLRLQGEYHRLAHRDGLAERAVLHPQVVEHPQRLAGEVAQLGVVPLALQLGDDHHREHDLVLLEAMQRAGVGEQDAGVQDEGVARPGFALLAAGGLTGRGRGARALLHSHGCLLGEPARLLRRPFNRRCEWGGWAQGRASTQFDATSDHAVQQARHADESLRTR